MANFDDDREFAREMIAENGAPVIFTRSPTSAASTPTGQLDTSVLTPLKFTRQTVIFPATPTRADGFEAGLAVRRSYRTFYSEVVAGGPLIQAGDTFFAEGKDWAVVATDAIAPDSGTPIFQSGAAKG